MATRNKNIDPDINALSVTEKEIEKVLRPAQFGDFTGQHKIVENLKVFVKAALLPQDFCLSNYFEPLQLDFVKMLPHLLQHLQLQVH